jgi:hypothetical protein
LCQQLAVLLDRLASMENFLECHGWTDLEGADRLVLGPLFQRLARDAKWITEGAADLAAEMLKFYDRLRNARTGRQSTVLAANIDFKAWADYLGDPPLATAFLDRLVD